PLSPANVYGRHKLEAEARVMARCPDAVALRLPWMYDLPGGRLPIRGNLPLNLLQAAKTGEVLHFSHRDHRGVGYVREVIANLLLAMALPGGVYNFGSGNDKDMVDTALYFAHLLQVDVRIEVRTCRNLVMDGQKLQEHGIVFRSTQGAFRRCLADHGMDI
ncbi:MAG: sugar nucleotide-binding protein, partial [Faecalibacterium prausnitzii]